MKNTYVLILDEEDKTYFYLHFNEQDAVRQIEIGPNGTFLTNKKFPFNGDSMLYDQDFSDLENDSFEIISELDFNSKWTEYGGVDL